MKEEFFDTITIQYLRRKGAYGVENMKLMETLKNYLYEQQKMDEETVILGIALDNPNEVEVENLRYDVGIIAEEKLSGLETRKIDSGTYAVFEVEHTQKGVQDFWQMLPNVMTKLHVDGTKPIIERYALAKIRQHKCEFCVPLLDVA